VFHAFEQAARGRLAHSMAAADFYLSQNWPDLEGITSGASTAREAHSAGLADNRKRPVDQGFRRCWRAIVANRRSNCRATQKVEILHERGGPTSRRRTELSREFGPPDAETR